MWEGDDMRPTLLNHQKFKRLCAVLKIPKPHAVGYLELLWHSAYESGDPRIGDTLDVELACEWPGEPGQLAEALASCGGPGRSGFTDEKDGIYTIHDLYDHAPDYVQKRARRESARKEKGKSISDMRREAAAKRWNTDASVMQTADTCMQTDASVRQNDAKVRTPAPAPAPTHTPSNKIPPCIPPKGKRATQMPDGWTPTPKHKELAMELSVDMRKEEEHFRDWSKANGKTYKDWDAGFRTWLRNAKQFNRNGQKKTALQLQHEENQRFLSEEWMKAKAEEAAEDAKKKHDY